MAAWRDNRQETKAIELTMEEWDALVGGENRRYAGDLNGGVAQKIRSRTPGARGRRLAAKREVDARRPVLDANDVLEAKARELVDWHLHGPRKGVGHLGDGVPVKDLPSGISVWVLPGLPHMGFQMPEESFEGRYPYFRFTRPEIARLRAAIEKVAPVRDSWGFGNGVSFSFTTKEDKPA